MNSVHRTIKEFKGHSGSKVSLKVWPGGGHYVEKVGNIERNLERMRALSDAGYFVPKIYLDDGDYLLMEYIHGLDMKNYLIHNNINPLLHFITDTMHSFAKDSGWLDYYDVYQEKLDWLTDDFPFTKEQLIRKLPRLMPRSMYHGDFTLENILYTKDTFCMIDPVSVEYDSYIFDIVKLRQDLECKWFLRNSDVRLDTKLQNIRDALKQEFPEAFDNSLLILMLLRVIKHCEKNDSNYNFLMKEINRLWKL